ncbi:MAG TPA: RtcB family protein [Candidatus Binatia bacterium]|jgi:tRNA-splicing ligase RtcB|nr:RtcB family protein [Candidatus Binatia bacterium]
MNTKDFIRLGVPLGEATRRATDFISEFILAGGDKMRLEEELKAIIANPPAFTDDCLRGELAKALLKAPPPPRTKPVKYRQWGEGLEHEAVMQMEKACLLPIAVAGALMPDAHVGYGLPIGGVLATENTVIPYAVGVDIACRMKMTVLDIPLRDLERHQDRLTRAIEAETRFGVGANFKNRRHHEVLDADWSVSPVTSQNKDRAWSQLGTSGSGNHFVEFGLFTVHGEIHGLAPGTYVALLSHSGSRGTGAAVCDHYSKIAFSQFPDLPKELKRLAWLSLDSQEGQEYWAAMELMGRYAAANHALIHKHVAANLGAEVLLDLENHHNFAWKERHVLDGVEREVIVHRKGATPAGLGVLGIIPGSMASPGFVVAGKGNAESLNSASHGAGRLMSRKAANEKFNWKDANRFLRQQGVTLISAGLDEVPMVYKNIHQVMAAQSDLVTVLGQFDPKLVKMAPAGERPED